MKLRRKLLAMPQKKWDGTVRTVRMNGLFTLAAIVATAMITQATLIGITQGPYDDGALVSRWVWLGMKVVLIGGIIATAAVVLMFEILGLRREHLKKKACDR
jgi:hypothetical protein